MSELINMHKRIAMGGEQEANHLKKGGKVKKYAKGGQVVYEGSGSGQPEEITHQELVNKIKAYPESKIRNLPAKGSVKPLTKPEVHSIATMKRGGSAMVGKPMKKAAGRGR